MYHTLKGHLTYALKNLLRQTKRNPKKTKKLKEKNKRVKGKTPNQQPPEKAKRFPKLPPTQNSEVNLLNLHPSSHAQPPSKNPLRLQINDSETSKDQYSKVTPSLALPKDRSWVSLKQNSSEPQVIKSQNLTLRSLRKIQHLVGPLKKHKLVKKKLY